MGLLKSLSYGFVIVIVAIAGWQYIGGYFGVRTPTDWYDEATAEDIAVEILDIRIVPEGTSIKGMDPFGFGINNPVLILNSSTVPYVNLEISIFVDAPAKLSNKYFWRVFDLNSRAPDIAQHSSEPQYIGFTEALLNTGYHKVYFSYTWEEAENYALGSPQPFINWQMYAAIFSPEGVKVQQTEYDMSGDGDPADYGFDIIYWGGGP